MQNGRHAETRQQGTGRFLRLATAPIFHPGQKHGGGEWRSGGAQQRASHVLQYADTAEKRVLLEGSMQAAFGQPVRRQVGHVPPVQQHLPVVRDHIGGRVEAGALAGAVGSDDPEDLTGPNGPGNLGQRAEPAETNGQATHFQTRRFGHGWTTILPSFTTMGKYRACNWPLAAKVASPKIVPGMV